MNYQPDAVIIGGGVIGVCSAYYLASKGMNVTLIEKGEIGSGCSYGNGGLIVPSHAVPLASPGALGNGLRWLLDTQSPFYIRPRMNMELFRWLIQFALASRRSVMLRSLPVLRDLLLASRALYIDLAEHAGFDFGFESNGSLLVCLSKEKLEQEKKEVQLYEVSNMPAQIVNQTEAHDLEPALLAGVIGGVYYPRDGHINPLRFVRGLAKKAQEFGAEISTNTEVIGFETAKNNISTIKTTRGDFSPGQVILASGSWSPEVVRGLKLSVPIQAAKGYSVTLENPTVSPKMPLLFAEARVVVNPLGDSLRIAGTLELAGMDLSFNSRRIRAMQKASAEYLPGIGESRVIEIWRGLRPCTPDGLPIIGRPRKLDNLIIASGHAMLGMSLGPITGKLVSQIVQGEKTEGDVNPFRLERFW